MATGSRKKTEEELPKVEREFEGADRLLEIVARRRLVVSAIEVAHTVGTISQKFRVEVLP